MEVKRPLWQTVLFFASMVGVFMYFATLREVPILQGLLGSGMGKGPALARIPPVFPPARSRVFACIRG